MTKPKTYALPKREAKLGTSIPFRAEFHGDEAVAATDVPISGVMLTQQELCDVLQEPLAARALFVRRAGSTLDDPLIRGIQALKLVDKIDTAKVMVFVGVEQSPVDLGNCKIKGITLEPKTGGLTEMSFKIQANPTLDKRIGVLLEHMDAGVMVEIGYEHNAEQQQLPMGAAAAKEAEKPKDDKAEFEAGAKAQVAAFKNGKKAKAARNGTPAPDAH
jgi:hypothetical protein